MQRCLDPHNSQRYRGRLRACGTHQALHGGGQQRLLPKQKGWRQVWRRPCAHGPSGVHGHSQPPGTEAQRPAATTAGPFPGREDREVSTAPALPCVIRTHNDACQTATGAAGPIKAEWIGWPALQLQRSGQTSGMTCSSYGAGPLWCLSCIASVSLTWDSVTKTDHEHAVRFARWCWKAIW